MNRDEFDFVEQPAEDFFCPVTLELLLNPHQTRCCGNHLSEKAVDRLQREGKSCPMCKEPKLFTIPDKYFKRKTSAVLIRCPYKKSGCKWEGGVGMSLQHINACSKRQWKCQYCDFQSTFDTVVERHCAECPFEIVACELAADIGCKVRTTRQDLKHHMEENQQEHLLSATLLNLRLTRETIAEKDRQVDIMDRQVAEKNYQVAMKDHKVAEMQKRLAEKDRQLAEKDLKLSDMQKQLVLKDHQIADKDQQLANKDSQMVETFVNLHRGIIEFTGCILGFTCHRITLEEFSECQRKGTHGDWHSETFFSYSGESIYRLQLTVETRERGTHMFVRLKSDDQITCEKTFVMALQMLNQQSNHNHYFRLFELQLMKNRLERYSSSYDFVEFEELYRRDRNIQYLKDDYIKFVLWIKEK